MIIDVCCGCCWSYRTHIWKEIQDAVWREACDQIYIEVNVPVDQQVQDLVFERAENPLYRNVFPTLQEQVRVCNLIYFMQF